jgi:hypothetical protein
MCTLEMGVHIFFAAPQAYTLQNLGAKDNIVQLTCYFFDTVKHAGCRGMVDWTIRTIISFTAYTPTG